MGSKIIAPLVIAAALFAAGGLTAAAFGSQHSLGAIKELDMYGKFSSDDLTVNETVSDDREWHFNAAKSIGISTSCVKTRILPSDGEDIVLNVNTKGNKAAVKVMEKDGYLAIGVDTRIGFAIFGSFSGENITATISLPRMIYDEMELRLGSGSMEAQDTQASENKIKIGSGALSFSMANGFSAATLSTTLGSGSVEMSGISAETQDIVVSSGKLVLENAKSSATDTLNIEVSSGRVDMTNVSAVNQDITVRSGELNLDNVEDVKMLDFNIQVYSGSANISNAHTQSYDIDVSSGHFSANGLSGHGSIDVKSGEVITKFIEIGSSEFDVSSGSLKVTIPKNTNANLTADVSSGALIVKAGGIDKEIEDETRLTLGNGGETEITADVGSGEIIIQD